MIISNLKVYRNRFKVISFFRHGKPYDTSQGRIPPSAGVRTMMGYLVFTNVEVMNYFIDKIGIERIIVTDDLSAQRLFHR